MNFKQLGDYAKVQGGYAYKSKDFSDTGIPVLKIKNVGKGNLIYSEVSYVNESFIDTTSSFVTKEGDVLISMTGSNINQPDSMVGRVARVSKDDPISLINQRVGRIIITDEEAVDLRFLYYILSQYEVQYYLVSNATGSANQVNINGKLIESIKVPDYNLNTQKKIAHILSTLDDKIELNRKMNQTLEEMAQALFKSWFVDFDPVHLKAGCKSDAELERGARELGISKEVLELFPSEFEESELGMIPEGWEVVKIETILKRYKAPKRYKKDAVKSYGRTMVIEQGADIILGYHDDDGEFKATVSKPMFIFGDHTCVMKLSTKPFSISENVIPISGCIRNGYWTYYATYGQQTFQEYRRHWSELIVRNIVLADEAICDFFAEQVQSLILKIEQNILENSELVMTRDALLPKLLSGELDISEIKLNYE